MIKLSQRLFQNKNASTFGIGQSQSVQVARLIQSLVEGERIAAQYAIRQAELLKSTDNEFSKRLYRQATQEKFHAKVFQAGLLWLYPKGLGGAPDYFCEFKKIIESDLKQHNIAGSILGLQIALEAMGDAFLDKLDIHMERRSMGLKRVRRIIREQEETHQDLGNQYLASVKNSLNEQEHIHVLQSGLQSRANDYVCAIDCVLEIIADDLAAEGLNHSDYSKRVAINVSAALQ